MDPLADFQALDRWVTEKKYMGVDPFDIRGHPLMISLQRLPILQKVGYFGPDLFPGLLVKALAIKPNLNAKALSLVAIAYSNMAKVMPKNKEYRHKLANVAAMLIEMQDAKTGGWSYPFDWQSGKNFFKAGTPSGVVTSFAIHGLSEAYRLTKDKKIKGSLWKSIAFFDALASRREDGGELLSYTPMDANFVYNANALSAFSLMRLHELFGNASLRNRAKRIAHAVLLSQKKSGAWEYGKDSRVIDNVHMGFTMEYLHRALPEDKNVGMAIKKGLDYYLKNLLKDGTVPKMKPDSLYPIDIHAASESVIMLSLLGRGDVAEKVLGWILSNMKNKDGSFGYRVYPFKKTMYPFMRWSQAWMLRAISEYMAQKVSV